MPTNTTINPTANTMGSFDTIGFLLDGRGLLVRLTQSWEKDAYSPTKTQFL
jgi:hypothetical protein